MRESKFEAVENYLSLLINNIDYDSYVKLIKDNEVLNKYDDILSKVDNGDYPESYKGKITDEELDYIIYILKNKISS